MKRLTLPLTLAVATVLAELPARAQDSLSVPQTEPALANPVLLSQTAALSPQLREAVLRAAASQTGQPITRLRIDGAVPINWGDSCLGLGGPAETCLQTTVPGWWITIADSQRTYNYRTDSSGTTIRVEGSPTVVTPPPAPTLETAEFPASRPSVEPESQIPIGPGPVEIPISQPSRPFPTSLRDLVLFTASEQTGLPFAALQVVNTTQTTWPDSCLGLGNPDEFCNAVQVPGWRAVVSDGQDNLTYRLDSEGVAIRPEEIIIGGAVIEQRNEVGQLPASVAEIVRETAASETNSSPSRFELVSAARAVWPDGCLGLPQPDEFCTQMTVPGWEVTVQRGRRPERTYRTDAIGLVAIRASGQDDVADAAATPQFTVFDEAGWRVALYWARDLSGSTPKVILQAGVIEKPPTLYANAVYQLYARQRGGRWVNVYSNLGARLIRNGTVTGSLPPEIIDLGEYEERENQDFDWSQAQLRAVMQIRYDLSRNQRDLRLEFEEEGRYRQLAIVDNPILIASPTQPLNPAPFNSVPQSPAFNPAAPLNSVPVSPVVNSVPTVGTSGPALASPSPNLPTRSFGNFERPDTILLPVQQPPIP